MKLYLLLCLTLISVQALGAEASVNQEVVKKYANTKEKVVANDREQRVILSSLFKTTWRMKEMSRKRNKISDQAISIRYQIKDVAQKIVELEKRIGRQKDFLSKRLQTLYKIGSQSILRALFSNDQFFEFEQTMKYLKTYSESDFELMRSYEESKLSLLVAKSDLNKKVEQMLKLRNKMDLQERQLEAEQKEKAKLLTQLRSSREKFIDKMRDISSEAKFEGVEASQILNSFFEQKGRLEAPVTGELVTKYGLEVDNQFNLKYSHKGLMYQAGLGADVFSVFKGVVSFVGKVPGYGNTVIVNHGDHFYSVYGYNKSVKVKSGERVKTRQAIAEVGSIPSGPSGLYFEIRHFSDSIDPEKWLTNDNRNSTTQQL